MSKNNHHKTLGNRILGAMLIVPAIPFILLVVIGYYHFSRSLENNTISRMDRIVEDHKQMIERFLQERKSDLKYLADVNPISDLTSETKLKEVFSALQEKSPAFTDIGVFNQEGVHLTYIGPFDLAGKVYAHAQWFLELDKRDFYISDVFLGYRQIPHFIIAVVKEEDGRKWVIRATIDTSIFSKSVERVRVGQTGEAYLLNKERLLQTLRRSGGELMDVSSEKGVPPIDFKGVKDFVEIGTDGEQYLYAASWLDDKEWLLIVRQQKAEAFGALTRLTYLVVLVTVLGGAFIVFTAFKVTGLIIGRLETTDTEKKELGRQLVLAGRLAEIGEMSAGFAHEINNPLQIIKSELTLVDVVLADLVSQGQLDESDDLAELLDSLNQIKVQVDRCGGITQGLLKFARKKESAVKAVEMSSFLPGVIHLVAAKAHVEGINIQTQFESDDLTVRADPVHLEQVMINLLNNAIHAVVEKNGASGGEINIRARSNGMNRTVIEVKDNGAGISPENLGKIFTPFFTTKPVGQGSGLGLSICYGIISEMGGEMTAEGEPGGGATFSITLPAA